MAAMVEARCETDATKTLFEKRTHREPVEEEIMVRPFFYYFMHVLCAKNTHISILLEKISRGVQKKTFLALRVVNRSTGMTRKDVREPRAPEIQLTIFFIRQTRQ